MGLGGDLDQTKTVELDRGLFLVHYKAADDLAAPPRVLVAAAPGSERKIEFLLHPDAVEPALWQPNSGLVVRVDSAARLHIQVLPSRAGGSRAATIRVEPIHPGLHGARIRPGQGPAPLLGTIDGLRILAHVAGIGDVAAGPDSWIAGPTAPSRIEGLALEWPNKPVDLDIRYAVKLPGPQNAAPNMVPLGAFAGTRGRALPITGLILDLAGRDDVQFVAEALFLNAPTLKASGRRIALAGPTGREPMVGLRINLEILSVPEPALPAPSWAPNAVQPPASPQSPRKPTTSGRVRVFRSRSKQESSAK